ncbi:hypothetical protein HHH54_05505 [Staphylococcus sp. H16/1A]|uniref:DUF5780 domain-containing protein n=2 Tax=Staphylococcus canis TaxID=2724942 RepID=A0ABS0T8I3_9STAP|nr:hypothetical protein [Staphylococcus canis]
MLIMVITVLILIPDNDSKSKDGQSYSTNEEVTPESLEKQLDAQEVVIQDAYFTVQHPEYKSLYPDLIQTVVQNNSSDDIKKIVIGVVAWDNNGLPISIPVQYSFGKEGTFEMVKDEKANIISGGTYGSDMGIELDKDHNVHAFKTIIVEYEDYDGNTWHTPELYHFKSVYEDKRLKDIPNAESYVNFVE